MPISKATTVADYLASLPEDRRAPIEAVVKVVRKNLPKGFVEAMGFGMICWNVPLARCPDTYNGQPLCLASLAAQKGHNALYLMSVYGDPELQTWFVDAYKKSGKKLDMGKSCVRFKALDALPLDVIGQTIAKVSVDDYVARYEQLRAKTAPRKKKAKA